MNKVVIAVVPGWAVGGGHSLHRWGYTIAWKNTPSLSRQMRMSQVSTVGLNSHLARQVGQKRAREILPSYIAQEATKWEW